MDASSSSYHPADPRPPSLAHTTNGGSYGPGPAARHAPPPPVFSPTLRPAESDELVLMPAPVHCSPAPASSAALPSPTPADGPKPDQQHRLHPYSQQQQQTSPRQLPPLLPPPPATSIGSAYALGSPGDLAGPSHPSSSSSYYGPAGGVGGTPQGAFHQLPPLLAASPQRPTESYYGQPGPGRSSAAAGAAPGRGPFTSQPAPMSPSPTHQPSGLPSSSNQKRRPSASSSGPPVAQHADGSEDGHDADGGASKRVKTPRACDRCREKKVRCDLIPGSEPMICRFCLKNKIQCTFFLPITETRWKKRRTGSSGAAEAKPTFVVPPPGAQVNDSSGASRPTGSDASYAVSHSASTHQQQPQDVRPRPTTQLVFTQPPPPANYYDHFARPAAKHLASPLQQPQALGPPHPIFQHHAGGHKPISPRPRVPKTSPAPSMHSGSASGSTSAADRTHDRQARIHGPTSIPFLIHSSASIPPSIWERYDLKHHTTWEISAGGDGVVKVLAPPCPVPGDGGPDEEVSAEMLEKLVNLYFEEISHMFPVVTRHEFLSLENPSPLLLYSICALASTRRSIPRSVFASLRTIINGIIRQNDVLSDTSLVNVQSLLILSSVGDLHLSVGSGGAVGAASVRLGVAIRMAQDLGLHRDEIKSTVEMSEHDRLEERAFLELKRRVWAGCVIMDRWYSASLGTPMLIDLLDCDVLLPDPCEVPLPARINDPSCQGQPYAYASEFLKLSILLGRVTKTIYGPTGLLHANDHQLNSLLTDLKVWKSSLPPSLQFVGASSSMSAGMLHILYGAIVFLFFRVFMRISYQCPPHLQFSLDVSQWSEVVVLSQEAIRWIDIGNNDQVLDTPFISSYATTSLALVQYHTWARRKDAQALNSLRILRDVVRRWEATVQPTPDAVNPMSVRHKTLEVMGLLYSAAKHTSQHTSAAASSTGSSNTATTEERTLNPTTGVVNRGEWIGQRVSFYRDPTLPGGGIFLAEDAVRKKLEEEGLHRDVVLGMAGVEPTQNLAVQAPAPVTGPTSARGSIGGGEGTFNVNPHIQDIGLSNMSAALIDDSVNDPTFGGLFPQDMFPPATPGPSTSTGAGGASTTAMGPVEMLEGLPSSVFDWGGWDSYFGRWSSLDSSPDSAPPILQGPPGSGSVTDQPTASNGNGDGAGDIPSFPSPF